MTTVTLALTGASGSAYGLRLLQQLLAADIKVQFIISKAARLVAATETDYKLPSQTQALEAYLLATFAANKTNAQLAVYHLEQWMSPPASGSGEPSAMVICPCSTGCLSAIATGASNNLIERAADVALKERRKLILVPRETPLSTIHLQNMLTLSQAGAVILPAAPGFYHQPQSIAELIDFVVARILNQLEIAQTLLPRWGE